MVWGTGLLAADLPEVADDLLPVVPFAAALSPDGLGFSVEDAGVADLLAQPITKQSASSATIYNMRENFKGPPCQDTCVCLLNYSRCLSAIVPWPQQLLSSLVQCPSEPPQAGLHGVGPRQAGPAQVELQEQRRCHPAFSPGNSLS
jgi:hypothetical protein